jgi:multidrug efflux pump subunit AcrA (membrane-fusion protein)
VTLHHLKPDTTYEFRLVATNQSGTSDGVEETFTTIAASSPTVVTGAASGALTTSVTLSGSVNPTGSDTKYWFEYGTTSAYGSKTALVDAGSGTTASAVSATLNGLQPDTEYAFRLVASNKFGTSTGLGEVVTTASSSQAADQQAVTTDQQTVAHQEATVTTAKESLLETEATIASSDTPAAATIAADSATVAEDEATVASDQEALDQTTLRAPIAGTVTAVNTSVGAAASAGSSTITSGGASSSTASSSTTAAGSSGLGSGSSNAGSGTGSSSSGSGLFTIDSLGQLEIVAGFAEADATQIAVGQPVTITLPALPNTEVAGRVAAVSLTSTVVSDVVTYDETIDLINPPATVKEGMTADVSVVDQTATNVLYVPSAAITTTGTVSTVELLQNGKETVTRVTTGLVGNSDTQILSGLTDGEVVVEPTVTVVGSTGTAGTTTGGGFGGGGFGGGGGGGFASRLGAG